MIDLVLVLIIIGYAISGFRQGLVVGLLSLSGFVVGALIAISFAPPLAESLQPGLQRSFVLLAVVLLFAWLGQLAGAVIGGRLRDTVTFAPAQMLDQGLGALAGVVAVALVLWFVGGALRASPSITVARAVSESRVLAAIDALMPGRLTAIANQFRDTVAGSSFPRVFAGVAPEDIVAVPPPDPAAVSGAVLTTARQSIVKITGEAERCNRSVEGSGAVIAFERVVTNAHVVAGMRTPSVQIAGVGPRFRAQVVLFDSRRDIAVLAVPDLPAPALPVGADLGRGDDAVVAGFPRNGSFTTRPARVRSLLRASGEDIYGQPGAVRQVYQLFANVEPGNSGGPLLGAQGQMVGVVFAKSLDDPTTGYALTLSEVQDDLRAGIAASTAVDTMACAQG